MANKKLVNVLSTAALTAVITSAVATTAFAKIDGIVAKDAEGNYLNYGYEALKESLKNDVLGKDGAELYNAFKAGTVASYHDDKVGFVDAITVKNAAKDAALAGTAFDVNAFTESAKETVLPGTVFAAKVEAGKVVKGTEVKPTSKPVEVALAVESVTAINNKQVEIKFNKALDTTSALDEVNYEVKDSGVTAITLGTSSASLSADGKVVTLTLNNAVGDKLTNSTKAKVTVKKELTDADKKTLGTDYVNSAVVVYDGVIPEAQSIKAVGLKTLEVTFNEPIWDGTDATFASTDFTVKSGSYTYYVNSVTANKNVLTINVGTNILEGPVTVGINVAGATSTALRDYADIKAFKGEISFNYVKNATEPVATVKEYSQNSVTIKFDRPVNATGLTLFHSVKGVAAYGDTKNVINTDEVTFAFPTNKLPEGNIRLFLVNSTVAANQVTDLFGNKMADKQFAVDVTVDVTPPTVLTTKLNTNASFEINFSENVDATEAVKAANFKVTKVSDGTAVAFATPVHDGNKKVTLNFSPTLADNTEYEVVVKAMKDAVGNAMAAEANYRFTVGDNTNPTVTDAFAVNADGKIYITFSEPMNEAQMLDKSNYLVDVNNSSTYVALGANDTITKISDRKIVIDMAVAVATPNVKISPITDLAGKKIGSQTIMGYTTGLTAIAQESVQVSSAQLIAANKIKLTFNKELALFDNTEFDIVNATGNTPFTNDIQVQSVESQTVNANGVTEVILVLDKNVRTDGKYAEATTLRNIAVVVAGATNTKSVQGTVVGNDADTVADKVAPVLVKYDHDTNSATADVEKVTISGGNTIRLFFSEDMNIATISTMTFTVNGYTVTGVAVADSEVVAAGTDTDGVTADVVVLTVTPGTNAPTNPTVTQNYNIADTSGIVFTSGGTWTAR